MAAMLAAILDSARVSVSGIVLMHYGFSFEM